MRSAVMQRPRGVVPIQDIKREDRKATARNHLTTVCLILDGDILKQCIFRQYTSDDRISTRKKRSLTIQLVSTNEEAVL